MKKIILDTDIGSDIDDALALAYLLREPECELLGITTVSGQSLERARLASALCCVAGREDVPIYPGIEQPFLGKQYQPRAPQAEKLSLWRHRSDFEENRAIAFLQKTIRENPGEVTLVAIGPLTNVAALFCMDREIPKLLNGLVLMCGNFDGQTERPEWNSKCDWVASAIVYGSGVKLHRSYGLNVTLQVGMPAGEVLPRLSSPVLSPVADYARAWMKRPEQTMYFHDPLAAVCLFEPDICTYASGNVEVEIHSEGVSGRTVLHPCPDGICEVAVSVCAERFFRRFFTIAGH